MMRSGNPEKKTTTGSVAQGAVRHAKRSALNDVRSVARVVSWGSAMSCTTIVVGTPWNVPVATPTPISDATGLNKFRAWPGLMVHA